MSNSWYEVVEDHELLQGDLLFDCPIAKPDRPIPWPIPEDFDCGFRVDYLSVAIMTQSCDLANDKVDEILVAYVTSWSEIVHEGSQRGNSAIKGTKFRKQLVDGNVPSLSLLHKRTDEPVIPWSVVDFRHLFTIPKSFLITFAASAGSRLRLRSPYREHLAQAFSRYFMRVGLPHDAKAFEKEGQM